MCDYGLERLLGGGVGGVVKRMWFLGCDVISKDCCPARRDVM